MEGRRQSPPGCPEHPFRPVERVCHNCGSFICSICSLNVKGEIFCLKCIQREFSQKGAPPMETAKAVFSPIPFLHTLQRILLAPRQFFNTLPPYPGYSRPFLYGTVMTLAGLSSSLFVSKIRLNILSYLNVTLFPNLLSPLKGIPDLPFIYPGLFFQLLLTLSLLLLFLKGVLSHMALVAFGMKGREFRETLRVVSYASTASVLSFIPGGGDIVYTIWEAILMGIGFRRALGVKTPLAVLGAFSPFIFLTLFPLLSSSLLLIFLRVNLGLP